MGTETDLFNAVIPMPNTVFLSLLTLPTCFLLPGWLRQEESALNARDPGSILGLGRSPGEGNGNPLQYPCLENSMDKGAWWAIVYEVTKSQVRLRN